MTISQGRSRLSDKNEASHVRIKVLFIILLHTHALYPAEKKIFTGLLFSCLHPFYVQLALPINIGVCGRWRGCYGGFLSI